MTQMLGKPGGFFGNFIHGNGVTKASYLLMGCGHLARGKWVRGLLYAACEVLFILYLVLFGGPYLALFFENFLRGGPVGKNQTWVSDIWDDELGEYQVIPGDNSFLIVLYGVLTLLICILFLFLYVASTKESYALEKGEYGVKGVGDLVHNKFHTTLLALPMGGLALFTVVPLLTMILIAFTNYDGDHEVPARLFDWVGFQNFRGLFSFGSRLGGTFWRVLGWTLIWAFFATFTNYFGGMLLAIAIGKRGITFPKALRTFFMSTIAVPQFVTLLIVSKMLDPSGGIFSRFFETVTGEKLLFGLSPLNTRIAVLSVNFWIGVPYSMLMCSGILMNIPKDLYESGKIDGAGPIRQFFKITLPYMLFVTGPYLITQFIGNINNFNVIYLLSGGLPGNNSLYTSGAGGTDLLITWLYKLSLGAERNYKLAAVIGILMFVISSVCSLIVYNKSVAVRGEEDFQ